MMFTSEALGMGLDLLTLSRRKTNRRARQASPYPITIRSLCAQAAEANSRKTGPPRRAGAKVRHGAKPRGRRRPLGACSSLQVAALTHPF